MTESAKIRITDSTLRHGSHALAYRFSEEQVRAVVFALDRSGVEVSHGDGLGGSSFKYGFSLEDDIKLVAAAVDETRTAKIAVLLLPGLGTVENLRHTVMRVHPSLASPLTAPKPTSSCSTSPPPAP